MEVDLNWYLHVTLTGLALALALLYLVCNTASSRRHAEDSSFGSMAADFLFSDGESREWMVAASDSSFGSTGADFPFSNGASGERMAAAAANYCVVCTATAMWRCTGCRMAYYCSEKCQIIHWRSGHKKNCKDLRSFHNANQSSSTEKNASAVSARQLDQVPNAPTAPPIPEDDELATEIDASLESTSHAIQPDMDSDGESYVDASTSSPKLTGPSTNRFPIIRSRHKVEEGGPSLNPVKHVPSLNTVRSVVQTTPKNAPPIITPSAPFADEIMDSGPAQYPSTGISSPSAGAVPGHANAKERHGGASPCTICFDAPSEGACIPCGHLAGCMPCLNEIKAKNWGCPVCRTKIDSTIRIYAV